MFFISSRLFSNDFLARLHKCITTAPAMAAGVTLTLAIAASHVSAQNELFDEAKATTALGIPRAQVTPTLDGRIEKNEWRDAWATSGLVNQFEALAWPGEVTFWVKYDEDFLYIAARSLTKPESFDEDHKPVMPPLWLPKGDDSVYIVLAPPEEIITPRPVREPSEREQKDIADGKAVDIGTFMPSLFMYRQSVLDQQARIILPSRVEHVKWKAPHMGGYLSKLERGSAYDEQTNLWTVEYKLPLAELMLNKPIEGTTWGMQLARDYPMGNQNAITLSSDWRHGFWSPKRIYAVGFWNFYSKKDELAPATFLGKAPAVQMLDTGDITQGHLEPKLSLYNPTDSPVSLNIQWNVLSAYGLGPQVNQSQTIKLAPGAQREITLEAAMLEGDIVSDAKLEVTDQNKRVLFAQQMPVRNTGSVNVVEPKLPELKFSGAYKIHAQSKQSNAHTGPYDPIANRFFGEVELDARFGPDIPTPWTLQLAVRKPRAAEPLAVVTVHEEFSPPRMNQAGDAVVPGWFRFQVDAPKLEPGVYELTATVVDANGKPLASGTQLFIRYDHKKDLPWLGNDIGKNAGVLSPWTPIETKQSGDGAKLGVWAREYDINAGGFFDDIKVLDEPMLAGPMQVQIKRDETWNTLQPQGSVKVVSARDDMTHLQGKLAGSGFEVVTDNRFEYDGYMAFKITMNPSQEKQVDALRIRVPMHSQFATHLHSTGGVWMRSAVSNLILDDKQGQLWNSNEARGDSPDHFPKAMGSFKPYVWLGGVHRGLAFMADSDQGWVQLDRRKLRDEDGQVVWLPRTVPSIEVVREGDATYLVLNIIARPFEFDHPRTINFSLQATPIKPLPDDFRARRNKLHIGVAFPGYSGVWDKNGARIKMKGLSINGHGSNLYPLNWEQSEKNQRNKSRYFTPYQAMDSVMAYAEIDDPRVPGLHGASIYGYLHPHISAGQYTTGSDNMNPAEVDHRIWRYDLWLKNSEALDGLYFDNTFAKIGANLGAGNAYIIDIHDDPKLHGQIQPSYSLTHMREFLKRLRAIFLKHRGESHIWLHSTDAMMLSAFGFADYLMPGENYPYITPKTLFSQKGTNNPAHMQIFHNSQHLSTGTIHLEMWKGGWEDGGWHSSPGANAAMRDLNGWMQVHDTQGATFGNTQDWRGLDLEKYAKFLPYWAPEVAKAITQEHEEFYVSGWVQDGNLRVVAFNRNDEKIKVTVAVDPAMLDLSSPDETWEAVYLDEDEERTYTHGKHERLNMKWPGDVTGQARIENGKAYFTFEVAPRNFRIFMLRKKQ